MSYDLNDYLHDHEDYGYSPEDEEWEDRQMFADPGGNSALRAAGPDNPRDQSCPTCGGENLLTPADVAQGYQCDGCANAAEGTGGYGS